MSTPPLPRFPSPARRPWTAIRDTAEKYLPQMRHCTRCRADAVGLLDEDRTEEFRGCLSACATLPSRAGESRPYVAVASQEGILVNQHLGEARSFQIWESPMTAPTGWSKSARPRPAAAASPAGTSWPGSSATAGRCWSAVSARRRSIS